MSARVHLGRALCALACVTGAATAGDEPPSRAEIARQAKAAAALLEFKPRYATAFCVHPSGLFVTNAHALKQSGDSPTATLVLDAGLKTQKVLKAQVVRRDPDLDLALLRLEGEHSLATLPLGSDDELGELMELIAVGFPFGTALANKGEYPAISVNLGSVTSLRRDDKGNLHRIQLDAVLNPGNSGGPVLDRTGKVVGVVVGGIQGAGIDLAIPVSHLRRFLARPEIVLTPPVVAAARRQEPAEFRAGVVSLLPTTTPFDLELVLGGRPGREHRYPMTLADGSYRARAVPFPPEEGPATLRMSVRFGAESVTGTVEDRTFRVDQESIKLGQVRRLTVGEKAGEKAYVLLWDGRTLNGSPADLTALNLKVGRQSLRVDLAGALVIGLEPPDPSDAVSCTIVARQEGGEVGTLSAPLYLEGAEQTRLDAIRDGRFVKPLRSPSPISYLRAISSGKGDYIGQGKTYSYGGDELVVRRDPRGVRIMVGGWDINFGAPTGRFLQLGEYPDAKRHPFSGESPGIEFSGNGRGCNQISGKFVVWELVTRGDEVVRLAIDFTQSCEGKMPPLYGMVRVRSSYH